MGCMGMDAYLVPYHPSMKGTGGFLPPSCDLVHWLLTYAEVSSQRSYSTFVGP